jgi:hypothetical protein
MTTEQHQARLLEVLASAQHAGLVIALHRPDDLIIVRCQPETRPQLAALVELATPLGLRVKWCNDGTLVAIGIPTSKLRSHGKKGRQETPEDSA